MNRIARTPDGIELELEEGEAAFLRRLPQRVREVLQGDPHHPARRRLLPRHDGPEGDPHADEFRALLEDDLLRRKLDRLCGVEESLKQAEVGARTLRLTDEEAECWLMVIADLRLVLADAIGIDDEDWLRRLKAAQRRSDDVRLYAYLSNLQGALLEGGFGIAQPPL